MIALGLVAGCDTTGRLDKGFFNPGEVGRFKKDPLVVPIVNTLDKSIEEPNDEFTQATDIRADDLQVQATDYVVGPVGFSPSLSKICSRRCTCPCVSWRCCWIAERS